MEHKETQYYVLSLESANYMASILIKIADIFKKINNHPAVKMKILYTHT
jgi:hypothetical protein